MIGYVYFYQQSFSLPCNYVFIESLRMENTFKIIEWCGCSLLTGGSLGRGHQNYSNAQSRRANAVKRVFSVSMVVKYLEVILLQASESFRYRQEANHALSFLSMASKNVLSVPCGIEEQDRENWPLFWKHWKAETFKAFAGKSYNLRRL